jgi:hypothetical protein
MPTAKIDLITETPDTGEFALILVEDGPWPSEETGWRECLSRIQHRIYDAIDIAVDGHLAAKYPESKGRSVRVQIDSPSGLPPSLEKLVVNMREHIEADADYSSAVKKSQFIDGLRIVTGHEMGRFKNVG